MDYTAAAHRLSLALIPVRGNEVMLSTVPHRAVEDLALIYRVDQEEGISVVVNDRMLALYGVSRERLHEDALRSAPERHPCIVRPIREVLGLETADSDGEEQFPEPLQELYVATTADMFRGACVIMYPGMLEEAAERLGGSFYILPSSVHEVLLLPACGTGRAAELSDMVAEINEAMVPEKEKLSDSVYFYDHAAGMFMRL